MKLLVTGGAGFIGSHLCDLLASRQHDVLVADNLRTGSLENISGALASKRVQFERADILDSNTLERLAEAFRPEVVVHLAALVSVQEARTTPDLNFQLNIEATQRVIDATRACRARRLVFASSAAVYGDNQSLPLKETEALTPLSLYGAAKAASELLLHASGRDLGFDTVALRFFNVFGPRQRADSPYSGVISIFVDRLKRGLPVAIYGDGRQTRDFIPVRDVARAIAASIEHHDLLGTSINVCTGRRTSLTELVHTLESIIGRAAGIEYMPARTGDILHSGGDAGVLETKLRFRAVEDQVQALAELLEPSGRLRTGNLQDRSPA